MSLHPYGSDQPERLRLPLLISAAAIACAYGLHLGLTKLPSLNLWWLEIPSVLGFYRLLYWFLDIRLWKTQAIAKVLRISTPDFGGTWEGSIRTNFDDYEVDHPVTATIQQTWTMVLIIFETSESTSESKTAAFTTSGMKQRLVYTYLNTPKHGSATDMHTHEGCASLWLSGVNLEGEYFTGRDRGEYGNIVLRRAP